MPNTTEIYEPVVDLSLVGPFNAGCLPTPSSGLRVFPQSGLDVPVPHPNATWTVGGVTLISTWPVPGIKNGILSWAGMGMITLQSDPLTVIVKESAVRSIWELLGTIAGAFGGMYVPSLASSAAFGSCRALSLCVEASLPPY